MTTVREVLVRAQKAIDQAVADLGQVAVDTHDVALDPKQCPQCCLRGRVKDARASEGSAGGYRRRYNCPACGARWSTREVIHSFTRGSAGKYPKAVGQ